MRSCLIIAGALLVAAGLTFAQPDPGDAAEQERLEQERIRDIREMARQQAAPPGVQVWGMAMDGPGNIMRIGGPGRAEAVPEQMILVGAAGGAQWVFVIHGFTLRRYATAQGQPLELQAEADLRTEEELERAADTDDAYIWPDPAMVPAAAEWSEMSGTLLVLRGGVLTQFSPELEALAQFDLRTEREKQGPRIHVRMQPGPMPPPPPPDAAEGE